MKKKLLIINKAQFGYHTDSYQYCEYLKNKYDITYMCFDTGQPKYYMNNIDVQYIPYKGSFLRRGYSFIKSCRAKIKFENYDMIFVVYLQMASLIRLGFDNKRFILDIRTGGVAPIPFKRYIYDKLMVFESIFFPKITIISECLREKLKLSKDKCQILPLGSDILSTTNKDFSTLKLLYVGILTSRNIHETVEAVGLFLEKNQVKLIYDIFGDGSTQDVLLIKKMISKYKLEQIVTLHGRKSHLELKPYFDTSNIGVSYIPITDYYDCQPPTKTFEYINSGMVCLATETKENKKLINKQNGILCKDTASSFLEGLLTFNINRETYNSNNIIHTLSSNSWNMISNKYLYEILEK